MELAGKGVHFDFMCSGDLLLMASRRGASRRSLNSVLFIGTGVSLGLAILFHHHQ